LTQTPVGETVLIETPDLRELAPHEEAWRDLAARAAEPNAFAEADFLIPALARLAPRRVALLLLWRDASKARLIGVAAIEPPRLPLDLARVWRSEQAALAALLIDRDATAEALAAILAWVRRRGAAGLLLPFLPAQGPVAEAVAVIARRDALSFTTLDPRRRAALPAGPGAHFEAGLDKKRRKEWARQRRRLEERGRLESGALVSAGAADPFLALESLGWKGKRGGALAKDAARAAFTREMLQRFAARGALIAAALTLDGAPIAIGLALQAGERVFYWKTAYDERLAGYSPGVLLTLDLSRRLERAPGVTLVDSCAAPNHPMIDRLWPARITIADFAVAADPAGARRFNFAIILIRLRKWTRERLKRAANRLLRRKAT
jgi:CelD/BcsL family acetyltransferase involved in cellulose biosynthesis